jgi:hypothetical protein
MVAVPKAEADNILEAATVAVITMVAVPTLEAATRIF